MQPDPGVPSGKDMASDRTTSLSDVPCSKNTASKRASSPSGIPSSKDMPPEQSPVCSGATGSTLQSTFSAPATREPSLSCCTGVGLGSPVSKSLPHADCDPQQAQQPPPVERCADYQERVSDQRSSSCSRPTPSDAGASSIDEQAPQPCPAKAEGKA